MGEYEFAGGGGGSGGTALPDYFVVTDSAYGAKGDGSTDDWAAVNLAIDALNANGGGHLYFPQTGNSYHFATRGAGLNAITKNAIIHGTRGVRLDCPAGLTSGPAFITLGDACEVEDLLFTINNSSGSIIKINGVRNLVNKTIFGSGTVAQAVDVVGTETILGDNTFDGVNANDAIRIGAGAYRFVSHDNLFEAANPGGGSLFRAKAGALEFTIVDNSAANCGSAHAVVVETGASDWYVIQGNNFIGLDISDGGSGTNKLVNDNPVRV